MPRTLLTGASGLLGTAVVRRLEAAGHTVVPCYHNASSRGVSQDSGEALDVTDPGSVARVFGRARPELVVHCAAVADAGRCEDDPNLAWLVNATGTELIAAQAARHRARLVHVSTDWVFAGTAPDGYREDDPAGPLQVYGRTKLAAERAAADVAGSLVVRVPLLYSLAPSPRPTWPVQALAKLSAGQPVLADDVEIRQPAMTADVAGCLVALIRREASGTVHVAPAQTCTKFAWARLLASGLQLPEELVRRVRRPERPVRPLRATLRTGRLAQLRVTPPRGVTEVAAASRAVLARLFSPDTSPDQTRELRA